MTDFDTALDNLLDSINADCEKYYKEKLSNLTFVPVERAGGRKYVRINHENRVYCFVAAVDVPEKNVKKGDVLMAATWAAPALNRKIPAAANIFKPESYENVDKAYGGWLYAK